MSEENYNSHTNNHIGYSEAHSEKAKVMQPVSMEMTPATSYQTNDDPFYNESEDPFSLNYSNEK